MKLEKILDRLNSFEKNSFLKVVTNLLSNGKDTKVFESIMETISNRELKNYDSIQIVEVFNSIKSEFVTYVKSEYSKSSSQFDLLIDLVSRDGNCIMRLDWFSKLYSNEINKIEKDLHAFKKSLIEDNSTLEKSRIRDYMIYKNCLKMAYHNDEKNNCEAKITSDEQSILDVLSTSLELSQDEKRMLKYSILPIQKNTAIDVVINELKEKGIVFYSKKNNTIYVADEIVALLRQIRGKEIADKYFRRVLLQLRDSQVNAISKKHGIDIKLSLNDKINKIVKSGVSFRAVLNDEIHKQDSKALERRKIISELCDDKLKITPYIKGSTLDEKITNLIEYFSCIEKDDKINISVNGYDKLLMDLSHSLPQTNDIVRTAFELQDENVMASSYLLEYNIKPRDILELLTKEELESFCTTYHIKLRGDLTNNILASYKDSENIFIENYENIGFRNLSALKESGIFIKEAELGAKFEEITKLIFSKLGFDVDEKLRKKINTDKDKIDVLLNMEDQSVILIECKTSKESGYNKFSSISRQVRAYKTLIENKALKVMKIIIIAPDFTDDFITDCSEDFELNMSLIKASSLVAILDSFKGCKYKQLPINLLMKDVLIQEDRIIKAINK